MRFGNSLDQFLGIARIARSFCSWVIGPDLPFITSCTMVGETFRIAPNAFERGNLLEPQPNSLLKRVPEPVPVFE